MPDRQEDAAEAKSAAYGTGLTVSGITVDGSDQHYHDIVKHLAVPADRQETPIFRNGSRAEIAALEHPTLSEMVDAMTQSTTPIRFDRLEDAQLDFRLRLHAIDAMTNFNTGKWDADYYNQDADIRPQIGNTVSPGSAKGEGAGMAASAGRHGGIYWQFMDPSDPWDAEWQQIKGNHPADGLEPTYGHLLPFRGECAGAFQLAVYLGILKGLGREYLERVQEAYGLFYVGPWRIDGQLNPAAEFMLPASLEDPPIPGDYMYFKNKDDYLKWAPNGFWVGLNAIYVGKDDLGMRHYSGLGASWLSEVNLRSQVVNAYYHDCYPHTIKDPQKECRFTERRLLAPPPKMTTRQNQPAPQARATLAEPTRDQLRAAGFEEHEDGVFVHAGISMGQLGQALGIDARHLAQVRSTGLANPQYRVRLGNLACIVERHESADALLGDASTVSVSINFGRPISS